MPCLAAPCSAAPCLTPPRRGHAALSFGAVFRQDIYTVANFARQAIFASFFYCNLFTMQMLQVGRPAYHIDAMTGRQFDAILKELGLTRPTASKALGMSQRSITSFANCKGAVPRRIELAVKGLLAERQAPAAKAK